MNLHPFNVRRRWVHHLYRTGKKVKAKHIAHKYLKKRSNDVEMLEVVGRVHASKREWREALVFYKQVFNLSPNYKDSLNQVSRAAIYEKDWMFLSKIALDYPETLLQHKYQKMLEKKLSSLEDVFFVDAISEIGSPEILPTASLERWAMMDNSPLHLSDSPMIRRCLDLQLGGCYLGYALDIISQRSFSESRNCLQGFMRIHPNPKIAGWIAPAVRDGSESMHSLLLILISNTSENRCYSIFNEICSFVDISEFVDVGECETQAITILQAESWLIWMIIQERNGDALQILLDRNLEGTIDSLNETLKRILSNRDLESILWLLEQLSMRKSLFQYHSFRRQISQVLYYTGPAELAHDFACSTVEMFPQDGFSAIQALNSAIQLADDELILKAANLNYSMKNPSQQIDHAAIIRSCLRFGEVEIAEDLMARHRMRMDGNGHRLRVGYEYFVKQDMAATILAVERTPEKHRNLPHIRLMHALALTKSGEFEQAMEVCEELGAHPSERISTQFAIQVESGNYQLAFNTLSSHFDYHYGVELDPSTIANGFDYHDVKSLPPPPSDSTDFVSVIMTVHKWNDAFPLAVNSILNQSHSNLELIIVDDESPLDDVERYQEYIQDSRVNMVRMESNSGTYACRNRGIGLASGEYITFADSDDWNHPCRIEYDLKVIKERDAALTHGRYLRMLPDGRLHIDGGRPARFALMCMTWKAECLRDLGGFDSGARFSADSELFERARKVYGKRVVRTDNIALLALHHAQSLTGGGANRIDWMGPNSTRLRYVSGYQRWHQSLNGERSHSLDGPNRFFSAPAVTVDDIVWTDLEHSMATIFDYNKQKRTSIRPEAQASSDSEIHVGMATYPGGFESLPKCVENLLKNQSKKLTSLTIHVNGELEPPELIKDDRLTVLTGVQDITDIGKFNAVDGKQGYILTVDDDILYPHDYIERMVEEVDRYQRKRLIGVHGSCLPIGPPLTRWYQYANFRRSCVFPQEFTLNYPVNIIGTGTLAFHTNKINIPWKDFDHDKMVDLHLASWAQNNEIQMVLVSRIRNWLTEISDPDSDRIWQTANVDTELQWQMLEVIQRSANWRLGFSNDTNWWNDPSGGEVWPSRELPAGMDVTPKVRFQNKTENNLVTIYMPAYNVKEYIIEAVESALAQTYPNIEVCIHDDGSSDGTLELVRERYKNEPLVKITTELNGGIGHASNRAIEAGSGKYILQLDSDDILHPEAAERLVQSFIDNDGIVCAYGRFNRINPDGSHRDDGWENPVYSRPRLFRSMVIHHPRMFLRDAWKACGGFDINLTNAVDYDFFLRLSALGDMHHVRETLYSYRIHGESTSQAQTSIQDTNTLVVQTLALKREGLFERYTQFAPNPKFPRRISYSHRWLRPKVSDGE